MLFPGDSQNDPQLRLLPTPGAACIPGLVALSPTSRGQHFSFWFCVTLLPGLRLLPPPSSRMSQDSPCVSGSLMTSAVSGVGGTQDMTHSGSKSSPSVDLWDEKANHLLPKCDGGQARETSPTHFPSEREEMGDSSGQPQVWTWSLPEGHVSQPVGSWGCGNPPEVGPRGRKLGHWGYAFQGGAETPAPSCLSLLVKSFDLPRTSAMLCRAALAPKATGPSDQGLTALKP